MDEDEMVTITIPMSGPREMVLKVAEQLREMESKLNFGEFDGWRFLGSVEEDGLATFEYAVYPNALKVGKDNQTSMGIAKEVGLTVTTRAKKNA